MARGAQDFLLVTQNVDNLHERAGIDPQQLVHIHGDILTNRCTNPTCVFSSVDDVVADPVPICPICKSRLRPGVVWFDEELSPQQKKRVDDFLQAGKCDFVLVIGTTATFDYIVDWSLRAVAVGGLVIEVNPERTRLSVAVDQSIRQKAVKAVPKLLSS